MKIINDYYLIEPNDYLDQIKYLIDLGCKVVGCIKVGYNMKLFLIFYNRFGTPIEDVKFYKYIGDINIYGNYYIKW